MFIDLHMHEKTYSEDSFLELHEIVAAAKQKGLEGICITDHDSMGLRDYAAEYSRAVKFPVFTGIEYYSLQGDILAFGIEEYPEERLDAQTFIDEVKRQGGITISAHPFRHNNRGLGEHLAAVSGLDGVEVLNGSTFYEANCLAMEYARKLGMMTTGASDCHVTDKVGIFATYFPEKVQTMDEFIRVFRSGGCRPAYYREGNGYRIWEPGDMAVAI